MALGSLISRGPHIHTACQAAVRIYTPLHVTATLSIYRYMQTDIYKSTTSYNQLVPHVLVLGRRTEVRNTQIKA